LVPATQGKANYHWKILMKVGFNFGQRWDKEKPWGRGEDARAEELSHTRRWCWRCVWLVWDDEWNAATTYLTRFWSSGTL
jgi:hypothetical protein